MAITEVLIHCKPPPCVWEPRLWEGCDFGANSGIPVLLKQMKEGKEARYIKRGSNGSLCKSFPKSNLRVWGPFVEIKVEINTRTTKDR